MNKKIILGSSLIAVLVSFICGLHFKSFLGLLFPFTGLIPKSLLNGSGLTVALSIFTVLIFGFSLGFMAWKHSLRWAFFFCIITLFSTARGIVLAKEVDKMQEAIAKIYFEPGAAANREETSR